MRGQSNRRYPSPLRYPGGKGQIANYVKLVVLKNDLLGAEYVEPYAGGASVALSLLFEEFVSHVYINDLNRGVSTFWKVVVERSNDLANRILATKPTVKEWHRQREVQSEALVQPIDELDFAFSTFFLNRTNRSGIIDGGPIGGHDQTGPWKIDARYQAEDLARRVRKIGRFADRITVSGLDAKTFLAPWAEKSRDVLIYLDPPYFVQGSNLYTNYYSDKDHEDIATLTGRLKSPWIVTYDAVPEVMRLYRNRRRVEYSLSYSAAQRYKGHEVMFLSPSLLTPKMVAPTNISVETVDSAKILSFETARGRRIRRNAHRTRIQQA